MATHSLSPKHRAEILHKLRQATLALAHFRSNQEIKRQIKAQGHKLANYSARELALLAEDYFTAHSAALIEEAKPVVDHWLATGFFGKRAQRAFANIETNAQSENGLKSTTSSLHILGAK
jgi:ribose 5-phosphate isomerase RpiB